MKNDGSHRRSDPSNLTRRQVLQRFGMVGTSSLMMGAMGAWDLMGQPAGPRPVLHRTDADARVIVLGGGLSGLVVGYELGKLGYDYKILEARDRVGGLIWSVRRGDSHTELDGGERQECQFDEDQYFNAGAWRIPNGHQGVLGYCGELSVPVEVFLNTNDANYMWEEDPERGPLAGKKVRLREIKADLWGSTNELLAKALDQGEIDVPLSDEDKERLIEFLVSSGYLDSADYVYRPPAQRGSEGRYDLSALLQSGFGNQVRSLVRSTGGGAPVFQAVGGMQQIPMAFARAVGDNLSMGSAVQSVTQTEDGVRVAYKDTRTGEEHEETGDYCVCCLPMSVLKTIDVNLSPETAAVVEESSHSGSAKMGLQMKRRFWEEDDGIFGGHIYGRSLQLGEFSYPSNGYFTQKGVLLGFYGNGNTGDMDTKPVAGRVEHVLTQASKIHPQMRDEFEASYSVWWAKVEYSLGAYTRRSEEEGMALLQKGDGRIYFGSAGAGAQPAWMEGAIESAWRCVESVHERASAG